MSDVRIFIDGIEHPVDKKLFAEMMYSSANQADQWFYNNTVQGNKHLAEKWMCIAETARTLKISTDASISREENY